MATSHRDLDHWISRGVADILFPVLILQFIPYVVGQPGNGSSSDESIPRVSVVVLGPLVFALVFSMLICCFCYKFCDSFLVTTDEVESGVRRGLHRRTGHGLDTEVIGSFPCFLYSEVKGFKMGKGRVECAVCLNEFADHETLRLMPPCSHVFHADCIDVWLSSRSTCPVCRANLYPEPGESFLYPFIDPNTNPSMDPESGNTGRRVQESPDTRLIDNVTWMNQHRPPRSRSTGLSSWRIADMIFPRSHSTGHSLVQPCEDLDRFTLQLPKEVQRQLTRLNGSKSHMALPQARSSRSSYRSGSIGSQMSTFPNGRQNNRSAISLSFPFSFSPNSTQSSPSRSDPAALAKGSIKTNQLLFQKKIQGKDEISVNGHSNGSGQID